MNKLIRCFCIISSAWAATLAVPATAQNTWAITSGNWENTATWSGGTVPNSSNNVYIGSSDPPGSLTATVTLAAGESVNNVYVGYGTPTNGVLNLNGNSLTVSNGLYIGQYGGTGTFTESGGSFSAGSLNIYNGNSLTLGTADVVGSIDIESGASLTTVTSGNITTGGNVVSATLNLGANASMSGDLNIESSGAVLNLAGHNLSTNKLDLGYYSNSAVTLQRGSPTAGTLTVGNLNLGNGQTLALIAGDSITSIDIENGSSLTTATGGNITSGGSIVSSTLTLGADTTMSLGLNVESSGAVLNLAGHNLTAPTLDLGYFSNSAVTLQRGGPTAGTLTVTNLNLGNGQTLALVAGDTITNIDIEHGSSLTTAASGNITTGGNVVGATLNLGANASMSGDLNIENSGAVLNLAGHNLSTNKLDLGYYSNSAVTLQRGSPTAGTLTVGNLNLGNGQALALVAGDRITNIDIEHGSTLTTAASANISSGGSIVSSTLTLGANASMSGDLNIESSGAVLNLAGHNLSTNKLDLGYYSNSAVTLQRGSPTAGTLTVTNLNLGNGQTLALVSGDRITNFDLENGSTLTTAGSSNISTGGTVNGSTLNLGASANMSTGINVEGSGATLNLAGHNLTAGTLDLGYYSNSAVTFQRGSSTAGTLSLGSLYLGNGQNLTLANGDTIGGALSNGVNIYTGATLTTVRTSNITTAVNVGGATVNLGANLSIGNQVVNAYDGAILNLQGHSITASFMTLGYFGTTATLNRGSGTQGTLSLGSLYLGNGQNFSLISGDRVNAGDNGVSVGGGATLSTVSSLNITNNTVSVNTGGILNLGANLSLAAGNLNVQDLGSTFNAAGHALTATNLFFGSNGTAAVTVSNLGQVTATELLVGNATSLTLHGGDVINSSINLQNNSVLTVQQSGGTGLTLNGTSLSSLTIDPSSMDLIFTSLTPGDWDFRWKDPNGTTNWISTLNTMITDHQINLSLPPSQNFAVVDAGGYTYIVSLPEPSSLVLATLCLTGLGAMRMKRRQLRVRSLPR